MNTQSKAFIISMLFSFFIAITCHEMVGNCSYSTDLEIYTQDNIYYINELTVTNEKTNEKLTFSNKESLKLYISDVTSKVIIYNY